MRLVLVILISSVLFAAGCGAPPPDVGSKPGAGKTDGPNNPNVPDPKEIDAPH